MKNDAVSPHERSGRKGRQPVPGRPRRYLLVNLVARRARNIAAAAQAAGEPLDTKPVSMAIDEVYDGRLQVVHKE